MTTQRSDSVVVGVDGSAATLGALENQALSS